MRTTYSVPKHDEYQISDFDCHSDCDKSKYFYFRP